MHYELLYLECSSIEERVQEFDCNISEFQLLSFELNLLLYSFSFLLEMLSRSLRRIRRWHISRSAGPVCSIPNWNHRDHAEEEHKKRWWHGQNMERQHSCRQFSTPAFNAPLSSPTVNIHNNKIDLNFTRSHYQYNAIQMRNFHATRPDPNLTLLGIGIATAGAMYGASVAVDKWEQHQASKPQTPADDAAGSGGFFGRRFYSGGFESEITKDEAAKILGIRKSASAAKVKGAHRKLLMLNHPDAGGSTYIAGKINEAKEILLAGKEDDRDD